MNQDFNIKQEQIPAFKSHDEARTYFKNLYGDRFLNRGTDLSEGKRVSIYHLVKDPNVYQPYMESFSHEIKHEITNMDVFKSYNTIEIDENGNVHFES
ncbi:hypothetical protein [Bacillus sp. USDA818B3_A]|uniref:hypothetical protein n=1 Tax=Bacillus sp. USDA818B3_A TaxID=2698834 RepID=UPI00136C60A5|nr:hypothetical protein [Bacillus sp. USDA818B3_A]